MTRPDESPARQGEQAGRTGRTRGQELSSLNAWGGRGTGLGMGLVAVLALAACGGETRRTTVDGPETAVMIQKGTYVYNPNRPHPPVSLSRSDLEGIAIR